MSLRTGLPPRILSGFALILFLTLVPAEAFANWTAQGSFHYTNRLYSSGGYTTNEVLPIREADVEVIDANSLEVLATGSTGADGGYSLSVTDSSTRDVAVRVLSRSDYNSTLALRMVDFKNGNANYAVQSGTFSSHGSSVNANFGSVVSPVTVGNRGTADPSSMVFNVFDMALLLADWIEALDGDRPPLMNITWSPEGGRGGSFFSGSTIYLADDDAYDDPNILHEMGHFVDRYYGDLTSPGGTHYIGDSSQDPRLSWSEGFATYVNNAVLDFFGLPQPHLYLDRDGFSAGGGSGFDYSLESVAHGGAANERAVNAALWDMIDDSASLDASPGSDDDPLSVPHQDVWQVLTSFDSDPAPLMSAEAFWIRWFEFALGRQGEMETTFGTHDLDFFPDASEPNNLMDQAPSLSVGAAAISASLYSGLGDPALDEDFYRFSAFAGSHYKIELTGPFYGRPDPETFIIDPDTLEVLAFQDDILDPVRNRKGSSSANTSTDRGCVFYWSAPETKDYLLLVRKSSANKAIKTNFGTYQIKVINLVNQTPDLSLVSPSDLRPGERYQLIVSGGRFIATPTAAFSGSSLIVEDVVWLDRTRLKVTVFVQGSATPGSRTLTVTNPGATQKSLSSAVQISASATPQVLLSEVEFTNGKMELTNLGVGTADLGGWQILAHRDYVSDQLFTFSGGTSLAGGATIVVSDSSGVSNASEIFTGGSPNFRLVNGVTGSFELLDASGVTIDFAQFAQSPIFNATSPSATSVWLQPDLAPPASGYSIARSLTLDRTGSGRDWSAQIPSMPWGSANRENYGDRFESNDSPGSAKLLAAGSYADLAVSPRPSGKPADEDWFGFLLLEGNTLAVSAAFDDSNGDLDLELYPPDGSASPFASSTTTTDDESVALDEQATSAFGPGVYRVRVFGKQASQTNAYTLTVEINGDGGSVPTPTPTPSPTPTPTPTPTPLPDDEIVELLNIDFQSGADPSEVGWTGVTPAGFGGATSSSSAGLCMTVSALGSNSAVWKSTSNYVDLTERTVYRVRVDISTTQSDPNAIPLWELSYNNFQTNDQANPGFLSYGGSRWFLDVEGGANGIGRANGRNYFDAYFAPLALDTPQWNGEIASEGKENSAFSAEADPNNGMRMQVRVLDADDSIGSDFDSGTICIENVTVDAIPYEMLAAASRNVYNPPLDPESYTISEESTTQTLEDPQTSISGGTATIRLPGLGSQSLNAEETVYVRATLTPDDSTQGPVTVQDPILQAAVRNPLRKFPIEWKTDTLYRGRMGVSAVTTDADPVDVMSIAWAAYTFEIGGWDWVTSGDLGVSGGMARAGSPRMLSKTGDVAPEWVSFFHGQNVTSSLITNSNRLTVRPDFFNRPDLGMSEDPNAKASGGTDSLRIHWLSVDEVDGFGL